MSTEAVRPGLNAVIRAIVRKQSARSDEPRFADGVEVTKTMKRLDSRRAGIVHARRNDVGTSRVQPFGVPNGVRARRKRGRQRHRRVINVGGGKLAPGRVLNQGMPGWA